MAGRVSDYRDELVSDDRDEPAIAGVCDDCIIGCSSCDWICDWPIVAEAKNGGEWENWEGEGEKGDNSESGRTLRKW